MPLHVADTSAADPFLLKRAPESFLIFYSSIIDGELWCPDCVAVNDVVEQTFGSADGPSALIVYVGNKPEWKSPTNIYRGEPWKIQTIPTIVKLKDAVEEARLVEGDIQSGLSAFVKGA